MGRNGKDRDEWEGVGTIGKEWKVSGGSGWIWKEWKIVDGFGRKDWLRKECVSIGQNEKLTWVRKKSID